MFKSMLARIGAAVVVLLCTTSSQAAISAFWQQNEITPQAILADPFLSQMQSWSLMATTDGDWTSGRLRAVLPFSPIPSVGTFYYAWTGGFGYFHAKPPPSGVPAYFYFATYVTSPADTGLAGTQPNIFGGFPEGETQSFGSLVSPIPGTFSTSWGDSVTSPPGTYEIARLTFPKNVFPTVHWDPASDPQLPGSSNTSQANHASTVIIPQIPEPTAMVLAAVAGVLSVRLRKS